MPNFEHLQIDFDETIFNHRQYTRWADAQFVDLFGSEAGGYRTTFEEHHTELENGMRLYDNRAHVEKVTGSTWSYVSGVIQRRWHEDGEPNFCYPEAGGVFQKLRELYPRLSVLTFGDEGYQRFKIGLCPILRDVTLHIVEEPKREFIAREFPETERGILVDDRPDLLLPKNWLHIWLLREEPVKGPMKIADRVWQVSALTQVEAVLAAQH